MTSISDVLCLFRPWVAVLHRFRRQRDPFLEDARGIIHVGANKGQERRRYARYGLSVVWIEPIPEVFVQLQDNLKWFPRQRACRYLVTDQDGQAYQFHVANNQGESSSILELQMHRDVWPDVAFDRTILLESITLQSLVSKERINLEQYDRLLIDTQGSELLVLRGAGPLLARFHMIKVEVADFPAYQGGCQFPEVDQFLRQNGFREQYREPFAHHPQGGSYLDVIYGRVPTGDA